MDWHKPVPQDRPGHTLSQPQRAIRADHASSSALALSSIACSPTPPQPPGPLPGAPPCRHHHLFPAAARGAAPTDRR